jgi:hypothetical protein
MKTFRLLLSMAAVSLSLHLKAQSSNPATGKVGTTINKIGNKTAELAVKGTSAVADKVYESKVGPMGQTIYINKNSRYYYVNDKSKKVYLSKAKRKNNPKK